MTQTTGISRAGAPGSAYGALILGIIAVALFALPPAPIVVGAVGLAAALHARSVLRRQRTSAGTVPSLVGAILSVIGLATALPWVVAVILTAFAR